ncbi:hypothetical protein [Nocardioides silvaticus]|nr:hypothetical protein [Nocardioides silvaticus]
MKKFARRVTLVVASTTLATGMVAFTPAPSNALSDWPCAACKQVRGDAR